MLDLEELPRLTKNRDLLVFACLTGLRFSGFFVIRSEDVRMGCCIKSKAKQNIGLLFLEGGNLLLNHFLL